MDYIYFLLRMATIFIILLLIIRLLGKREIGQLSIFDLVILLIIADIGAIGVEDKDLFLKSVLSMFLLYLLQKLFSVITLHFKKSRKILDGESKILVENGTILYDNLHDEKYSVDDLISQIRMEGIMDIKEVRLAILETNGVLSIFSKKRYDKICLPLIISGEIDNEAKNFFKLEDEDILKKLNGKDLKDILYASYDGANLYICDVYKKKENK